MTTTVDLVALAASGQSKVTLLGGTITSLGSTGTDYAGFDDADSVYVEVQVRLRDNSRGAAQLVLLLEGSDDGNSWSTLSTFTFTNNGTQTASVSTPNAHLRVSWTVARNTEWFIDHVTVAPASLNHPGGGSQPVTCNLLVTALDVSTATSHALVWDAIQDNPWDENALLAIPAGLGMSFAFDGTDSTLTTTAAGTWALSLYLTGSGDIDWYGHYDDGLWGQAQIVGSTYGAVTSNPRCVVSSVMKLPSGAQLQPAIVTDIAANVNQTIDASLLLTRLG